MPLALQYLIVAAAVAISAWVVLRKQLPRLERRLRIALAAPLVREARPHWLRALGRRIAPTPLNAATGACGGCDRCETDPGERVV
ncbi:MAG: hypothetical protein KA144_06125 [Xanthomonadaceae bacterium]|nr:hypothetical protein [Xanthomonadaceae bacterium]